MNEKRNGSQPPASGMALNDIYYVLFRHKWKIIILSSLGIVTAIGIFFYRGTTYVSEADLWIKYVMSNKPQGPAMSDGATIAVDAGGEGIINTERAILGSFDLATQVATNIGPEKILAMAGGGSDKVAAASLIHDNLLVEQIPRSPVLHLVFSHPDKDLVQRILQEIVDDYKKQHDKLHGVAGSSYDMFQEETQNLKSQLDRTEEDLRQKLSVANVSDLDVAKKNNAELLLQAHGQLMQAQAELAQHMGLLKKLKKATGDTSLSSSTSDTSTNKEAEIPQDKIDDYAQNNDYIQTLRENYNKVRAEHAEHSVFVEEALERLDNAKKLKKKMETDEPRLAKLKVAAPKSGTQAAGPSLADLAVAEDNIVSSIQDKIKVDQDQVDALHGQMTNLDALTPEILGLERQAQTQEGFYRTYLTSLEQQKIDTDIGAQRNANIQVTQDPRPPVRERSKTPKMMGVAAAIGILAGLAWAFLVELYLDHSVRRPKEIEGNLGLRLFLSMPDVQRSARRMLSAPAKAGKGKDGAAHANGANGANGDALIPAANGAAANGDAPANGKLEIAPWDRSHSLHNYYEALRDRLISYFEVNNLNHKPKLVAVTGSSKGCGTTTIAAGLAASLSETGDGNVLLIDMNMEHGAAQQFYKGKPSCELDAALANETRDTAMVQNNLYVVSGQANGDQLSRMLPKRFANLLPKLKASDYDYIIFDMPPIARTGVTQRLAGFMDMMLLVVEAEKTSRDVVRQAGALLTESKANVSVVLNKTRTYIPARFHQEF